MKTPRCRNEKGFVVLTLALVPAFLALAFGAFHLNTQVVQERELQNLCRDRLLAAQKAQIPGIEQLLGLNPSIRALKIEWANAKRAYYLAVARTDPTAYLLLLNVKRIEKMLETLRARQLALFSAGKRRMDADLRSLRSELDRRVRARRERTATGSFSADFANTHAKKWALESQGPPYPEYRVPRDFADRQALQVNWNWSFTPHEGVEKWVPWKTRKKLRCGATLIRKAASFESRIHEGKSFSNWW